MQDDVYTHANFTKHIDTLAQQWFSSLMPIDYLQASNTTIRQTLALAAEQLVGLLLTPSDDPRQAHMIGEALVRLGYTSAGALGATLELLAHQLIEFTSAGKSATLYARLAILLGSLAAGFVQETQARILSAQEQIRQSQLAEIAHLTANLGASERYRHSVLANAPLIMMVLDTTGRITLIEGKGLRRLKRASDALVGKSIFDLIYDRPDIQDFIYHALAGESFLTVVELQGMVFEIRCEPFYQAENQLMGTICIALDVTTRARREAELLKVRQQLNEANAIYQLHLAQVLENEAVQQLSELQTQLDHGTCGNGSLAHLANGHTTRRVISQVDRIRQSVQSTVEELRNHQERLAPKVALEAFDVPLSLGEREVVQLLIIGRSNRQIGGALGISAKAVEKRLSKLYAKLGVTTRAEAVALMIRGGMV